MVLLRIEGHPFITRFKTLKDLENEIEIDKLSIEGHPFIIRFKIKLNIMKDGIQGFHFLLCKNN